MGCKVKILKCIFIGIVVAVGGLIFTEFLSSILNGLDKDVMRVLMFLSYICILIITCTGIILDKIKGDKDE